MARWMEKLKAIRAIRDALGHPVERGVEEPIAGLNLLGIPTVLPAKATLTMDMPLPRVSEKDVLSGIHPVAWKKAHKGMSAEETAAYRLW